MNRFTASLAILLAELRQLQLANQDPSAYPRRSGCFLDVSMRQERSNRFLLFTPELFAVSCHQVPSDAICGRRPAASPTLRQQRFSSDFACNRRGVE